MILKEINAIGRFDSFHNFKWRVSLFTGDAKEACKTDTDSVVTKEMSHENFVKLMQDSSKVKENVFFSIPKLPKYYFTGGISPDEKTFWVALHVPAAKRQYVNGNINKAYNLPYPSLVFLLKVNEGVTVERYCFAVKSNEPLTMDSTLYQYPYGHVNTMGSICMGNVNSNIASFENAADFAENFFLGKDLGHYYTEGVYAKPKFPLGKLVETVNKKGEFPDDWLMPTQYNRTLSDAIKKFL